MRNRSLFIFAFSILAAFATIPSAQPESDIAIPAERPEAAQSVPDLGQKEKDDWQRLREERKLARQQILTDIKASAKAEIKDIRQDIDQQKPTNNENWENFQNRGPSANKGNVLKGEFMNWNRHRPETPPFDTPKPDERNPFPKNF